VLESHFPAHGIRPNVATYRSLIRMFVRRKEIDRALKVKDTMMRGSGSGSGSGGGDGGLIPCGTSYGLLIESLTHRNELVKALKLLEEAAEVGALPSVPEKHLKHLRARCTNLRIVHPDMPSDPRAWSQHLKSVRRRNVKDSQRRIEGVRSALYS
jgi:pentatricopeptide repeat protein